MKKRHHEMVLDCDPRSKARINMLGTEARPCFRHFLQIELLSSFDRVSPSW